VKAPRHTPGPWKVIGLKPNGDGYVMGGDALEIATVARADGYGDHICFVDLDTGEDTRADRASVRIAEANARVVAAAPETAASCAEMRDFLQGLVKKLMGLGVTADDFQPEKMADMLGRSAAALEKAGWDP
jgi:hypothetical protein